MPAGMMMGGNRRSARPMASFLAPLALALLLASGVEGIAQIQCPNKFMTAASSIGKEEYSPCPVLGGRMCTSPKVTCASIDGNGDGYLSKEETLCSFATLWDGPKLLELGSTTAADTASPFADAGTISVQGQSFSLAFAAAKGSEGSSDWRPAVDCDADPRKSPMCFAAYTASLDTNKDGKLSVMECEASAKAYTDLAAQAVAYQSRGSDQDSKEDAKVNRRQIGSAVANKLVSVGVYQIGSEQDDFEEFDPDNQPWYLQPGSRWKNPLFRIVAYIYFGIGGVWFLSLFYCRFISKEKNFDGEQALNMTVALQAVALALWFFYDFSIMCARFNWLLTDTEIDYETWSTDYETPNEVLYWLGPKYWTATQPTLTNHSCPNKEFLFLKDAQPVPNTACNWGQLEFSADILKKTNNRPVETAAQQFSMGLGLFIWPILYIIVASFKILKKIWGYPTKPSWPFWDEYTIARQKAQNELDRAKPFCSAECDPQRQGWDFLTWALFFVATFLLGVQQSVVLLPVTAARLNPYCLALNIPASQRYGACVHKWAATGLPYGFILFVSGGLSFLIFWGMFVDTKYGKSMRENFHRNVRVIFSGKKFGTTDELVPVDEEGGHICHVGGTGEPYVLSSQTVIVQGGNMGQSSIQYSETGEYHMSKETEVTACNGCCMFIFGSGALLFLGLGIVFMAVWALGGMIIGVWFAVSEMLVPAMAFVDAAKDAEFRVPRFSDLSVIKNIIVPSVVIIPAVFSVIFNALDRFTKTAVELAELQSSENIAGLEKELARAKMLEERAHMRTPGKDGWFTRIAKTITGHADLIDSDVKESVQNVFQEHVDNSIEDYNRYGVLASQTAAVGAASMSANKLMSMAKNKAQDKIQGTVFDSLTGQDIASKKKKPLDGIPETQGNTRGASGAPKPPVFPGFPGFNPMGGSPPMTGFPGFFPGYAGGSPPPNPPTPPSAPRTSTRATPSMSTGSAAPVPPAPPVPPSAALGFPGGPPVPPVLPLGFGGSPPFMGMPYY